MDFVPPSCGYDGFKYPAENGGHLACFLGAIAAAASFEEVMLSPKPGLVCPDSSGSHSDMNWTTFLMGASALAPFWRIQALEGIHHVYYKPSEELMKSLRDTGLEMERAMFGATGGVNTHKGLIFALSLLVGASGACFARGDFSGAGILRTAGDIVSPAAREELEKIKSRGQKGEELTHGERIYFSHGIAGIRAEASDGFPSVRAALSTLEDMLARGASARSAAVMSLLVLMERCEDTNVIHRCGMKFWRGEYLKRVRAAMRNFDPLEPGKYESARDLDNLLIQRGASPGGAADLLACTLFMYRSKILDNSLLV
ncbi:MAG: triphosphoribosyl-dephospho-CoA synthase [Synergistaceae bacterium]|nr:triphosphoribosyl-dephospho-CoA synthase [Synergistaceae bacterium]